jgi:hypothetical protein
MRADAELDIVFPTGTLGQTGFLTSFAPTVRFGYEALLGNLHCAQQHLQISFKMDASFRDLASRDPDLEAVHALI